MLPAPDPAKLWRVLKYLLEERCLPPILIESLVQSGHLYADHRANAVFLLFGKENNPVGAELRGTTSQPWRGLAPGSQKDPGFFSIPAVPIPGRYPGRFGHRRDQLLCFLSPAPLHLHSWRPPQSTLAGCTPRPEPFSLLQLRRRSHRRRDGSCHDRCLSQRATPAPGPARLERRAQRTCLTLVTPPSDVRLL